MNFILIRTKLQAIIVEELISQGKITRPFACIFLFWRSTEEDSETVNQYYLRLEGKADRSFKFVQSGRLLQNVARLGGMALRETVGQGSIWFACFDFYPLALAARLVPSVKLMSFDEGGYNINPNSRYYETSPKPGGGLMRRILNLLLPEGPCFYLRGRVVRHFTIFPGQPNIVDETRLEAIAIDWISLLEEKELAQLPENVSSIVIGTVVDEFPNPEKTQQLQSFHAKTADLFLPHPRDARSDEESNSYRSMAPAEALIAEYASRGPLTIYHFGSTAAVSFENHPSIQLIDITP